MSDVVCCPVGPRDDEGRLVCGGQHSAFGHDRVEADVLARAGFAKHSEVARETFGESKSRLPVEEDRQADRRRGERVQ